MTQPRMARPSAAEGESASAPSKSGLAPKARDARSIPFLEKCYQYERANRAREAGLYTFFRPIESAQDPEVTLCGRRMVMLGSNNYLGLVNDPRVKEAAIQAIRKYGSGCAGTAAPRVARKLVNAVIRP